MNENVNRIVWGRPTSSNVMKVLWGLGELGLPFERIDVGGAFGKTDTPEYRAMNPTGLVPTLQAATDLADAAKKDGVSADEGAARDATTCLTKKGASGLVVLPRGGQTLSILGLGSAVQNGTIATKGDAALALNLLGAHRTLMCGDQHRHGQDAPCCPLREERSQGRTNAVADRLVLEQVEQQVAEVAVSVLGRRAESCPLAQSSEGDHLGACERV